MSKATNKLFTSPLEGLRSMFSETDFGKAIDLLAFMQTIHMRETGCKGPESGCLTSDAIDRCGKLLANLGEVAYPGMKKRVVDDTNRQLLENHGSLENIKAMIDTVPFTENVKERLKADLDKELGNKSTADEESPETKKPLQFVSPPSKLTH
jgi:hypothetical protein